MRVVIRVTARTFQRTFTRDFYRKRGVFTLQELAPCLKNLRGVHRGRSFFDRTPNVGSASELLGCKPRGASRRGTDSLSKQYRSLKRKVPIFIRPVLRFPLILHEGHDSET